jgi:predicted ATPase
LPEAQIHYERAIHLCGNDTTSPHLFVALFGLWVFHWGRGPFAMAEQIAARLASLAAESSDSGLALQACHAQWATSFSTGRLQDALRHSARGTAIYEIERHAAMASTFGSHDAGVCGLNFGAQALALVGRLEDAARQSDRSVALARRLDHPFSVALALCFQAMVHEERRDWQRTHAAAAEAVAISRDHSFKLMHAWASMFEGRSLLDSHPARGVATMEEALTAMRSFGGAQMVTRYCGLLGHGYAQCGRMDEARKSIAEGLELLEKTGERFYHAELIRLDGEFLFAAGGEKARDRAEAAFCEAMQLAHTQDAKLFELRAATSFARAARCHRRDEARERLGQALAAIPPGHGALPDLVLARGVLAQLDAQA